MQLKRVRNGGIVIKYYSDCGRGPGDGAPSRWAIFVIFQQKRSNFYVILFARFEAMQITKLLKFKSYFKEELNFSAPLAPPYFRSSLKYV